MKREFYCRIYSSRFALVALDDGSVRRRLDDVSARRWLDDGSARLWG
jgi:hypothetical protein